MLPLDSAPLRPALAPGSWPLVGHLFRFGRDPLRFLGSLPAHGDLVEIRLAVQNVHVLCHPDLARRALADGRTFDRTGPIYDRIRTDMGNGLATCAHTDHRRQRLLMQPAFRRDRLSRYAAVMQEEIAALADRWRPGQVVDVVDAMFALTTSIAVRTLFSSRVDESTAAGLRHCLDVFLRGSYTRVLLPFTTALPTPANRRFTRALAQWRAYVGGVVADGRQRQSGPPDLLSSLLEARDDEQSGMSERELADQIAVLVLAGAETTSAALAWSWHLLGAHPTAEEELLAEAGAVLGGAVATWQDLPRLVHTDRVVREALRLYPPAWALPRTVTRATELAGRTLPAGSTVLFSPYILHRRAGTYPEPDRFRPERWRPDPVSGRCPVPATDFFPFGAGATKCIGESFALTEASLALASLASRWRLRPVPGASVQPAARSVLCPRTLPMRVTGRH
ncbi:cytochrome P450 [Streptomyces sp. SCA3-4]|uniref:cytochrome P450 n=1 Tax=Streptomyces sichuanensis TaxID=2871810 RepID=UPI001CE312C9|nr:cytochrome P450 [Streptomyces sichuanensis]MCA6093814.1 cytochrome P450 [Streptomyces sichuanensis]